LTLDLPSGERRVILSDDQWLTYLDRAHTPGKPKRWFLRALQEEFDARRHPEGWDQTGFRPNALWLPARASDTPADTPAAAGVLPFWSGDTPPPPGSWRLLRKWVHGSRTGCGLDSLIR